MGRKQTIEIVIYNFVDLGSQKKCTELIDILASWNLIPLSYDISSRTKHKFDEKSFISFWNQMQTKKGFGIPFIRGKDYYSSISWGGAMPYNSAVYSSFNNFASHDELLEFGKSLFMWADACYGYIRIHEDYSKRMYTPGLSIVNCLPDITWANLFGKPYVDMWSAEKLNNSPVFKTQHFGEDNLLLLSTEQPEPDETITEPERILKEYLGVDYFYKQPKNAIGYFTDEHGNHILNTYDPYTYITPDFWDYYDLTKSTVSMPPRKK